LLHRTKTFPQHLVRPPLSCHYNREAAHSPTPLHAHYFTEMRFFTLTAFGAGFILKDKIIKHREGVSRGGGEHDGGQGRELRGAMCTGGLSLSMRHPPTIPAR